MTDLSLTRTERGFDIGEFTDRYGCKCSIQKSSLAFEDCIWLGIDDPEPQVMASQAASVGVDTSKTSGWVEYPIPDGVLISTQMHLTQDMVKSLLPILHSFVDTGEIERPQSETGNDT